MKTETLTKLLAFAEPPIPIAIMTVLSSIAGEDNKVTITQQALCDLLHISKHSVFRYLKKMKEIGVIDFPRWNRAGTGLAINKEYTIL